MARQSWPDLTQPNDPIYPLGASAGAVAVDDLWRATLMSRGRFVNARTPMDVAVGLSGILSGITNNSASRVGPAFSGRVLSPTNNVIYIAKIEPGWSGDLSKIEVDPATGSEVQTWWKASVTLKAQIDPVATGVAEPWMDEAHRRVVTLTGATGPGVAFRRASLSAPMRASLANTTTKQEKVISYIRGGNTYTDAGGTTTVIEGTAFGQFRQRSGALGDISNAQPVIVQPGRLPDKNGVAGAGPQVRPYVDSTDPGYSTYANSVKLRSTRIVAPANDGMVHVFDAGPVTPLGAGRRH